LKAGSSTRQYVIFRGHLRLYGGSAIAASPSAVLLMSRATRLPRAVAVVTLLYQQPLSAVEGQRVAREVEAEA